MDLTNLNDLQTALRLAGIKPKKGLGQHFLVDRPSLEAIMGAADLTPSDIVLEVGPGLGVMTRPLCERVGRVVAVEADAELAELLGRDAPSNLTIAHADALRYDLTTLPAGYKVVANLPYYLTSNLLRQLLESTNPPATMSLLVQKDVAERLVAAPGQLSVLALSVQYYAHAKIVAMVERHKFWPPPQVDSAVVRIERRAQPAFAAEPERLFRLVKAGFGERRKQLKNSLAGGLNASDQAILTMLASAEIDQTRRAQELDLADWQRLYAAAAGAKLI